MMPTNMNALPNVGVDAVIYKVKKTKNMRAIWTDKWNEDSETAILLMENNQIIIKMNPADK